MKIKGAFVYAITAADVVRLRRDISCAVISEVLLRMLCSQYCINERTLCMNV